MVRRSKVEAMFLVAALLSMAISVWAQTPSERVEQTGNEFVAAITAATSQPAPQQATSGPTPPLEQDIQAMLAGIEATRRLAEYANPLRDVPAGCIRALLTLENQTDGWLWVEIRTADGEVHAGCWIGPSGQQAPAMRALWFGAPPEAIGPTGNCTADLTVTAKRALPGDVNLDGQVNVLDLAAVNEAIGNYWPLSCDVDGSGVIDQGDLDVLAAHMGQTQTVTVLMEATAPMGRVVFQEEVPVEPEN